MLEDRNRGRAAPSPVFHPAAREEWFRALPHEHRARMNREWRAGLARDRVLDHGARRETAASALRVGALFAFFNGFCPGDALVNYLGAFLAGGLLGALLERLRAARLLSAILGLAVFYLFQWFSRGGLSYFHFLVLLPVGAISAHLGQKREFE